MTSGTTYIVTVYETGHESGSTALPTPTLTVSGSSPPTPTLITTNNFGSASSSNCNSSRCYAWTWWFTATSTSSSATVTATLTNNYNAVMDVLQLSGNASTPIVSGETNTASASSGDATADLAGAATSGDVALEIIGSDSSLGSGYLGWSPSIGSSGDLFNGSSTSGSNGSAYLQVFMTSSAVQNESTTASYSDWGTIAIEIAG
jgi:hypothetical protein